MVPKFERPPVTQINVLMDCNGYVHKIKKALHGIHGIYHVHPDIAQQKLIVIGMADPEIIVKAIRKTRKTATICSHLEPTEPPPEVGSAALEGENPPPPEEKPKDEPPPENPQSELAETDAHANQKPPPQPSPPKDVDHSYGGPWSRHHNSQNFQHELPPQPAAFVTHCYNTYMPSPYVTEYQYVHSPPRYVQYSRVGHCNEDYHNYYINGSNIDNNGNGSIASLFSDDNPNACTIM
ncbi:hypothetical protein ES288_A10G201900v1 [Gossypium darwinii]|uniref:HMA domain-containing protein n=1 Tax=Gossypium darwinii TaxID=34276 RepID=A0A5D2F0C8_GOSDA|nr:hypothetical protein ES288_A10G201900v1 [Gossypium darwinii]